MEILKKIIIVIYAIISVALILITVFQEKEDEKHTENEYEGYVDKNKGKTKVGKIQKRTIILGVIFVILTIVTAFIYNI